MGQGKWILMDTQPWHADAQDMPAAFTFISALSTSSRGVLLSQYLSLLIIVVIVVVVVGGGGGGVVVVLLPGPSSACTCELRSMLQSIEGWIIFFASMPCCGWPSDPLAFWHMPMHTPDVPQPNNHSLKAMHSKEKQAMHTQHHCELLGGPDEHPAHRPKRALPRPLWCVVLPFTKRICELGLRLEITMMRTALAPPCLVHCNLAATNSAQKVCLSLIAHSSMRPLAPQTWHHYFSATSIERSRAPCT
jgi:hypothetical protein